MSQDQPKERPLACSSCSKELKIKYTEVHDEPKQCFYMCASCPILQEFVDPNTHHTDYQKSSNLTCGDCATTLKQVQHGESLGCSNCYETFEAFILKELKSYLPEKADSHIMTHQGHKPGELKEVNPSLKILALNEALTKTLNEEDYEQAAWIRDQIKELKTKMKRS